MNRNGAEDRLANDLESIDRDLKRLVTGVGVCAGLLAVIAIELLLRLLGVGG